MIVALGFFLFVQVAQADWTPAKRLTWTSGDSEAPAIAVDSSGNLHLIWEDYTPGNLEIYYKRSADGGGTWSASKRLTWTSGDSVVPAIAIDSNNTIHMVWMQYIPNNVEIYYERSADGGGTWSASKRLTWTSDVSFSPAIAIDSSNTIHVVWYDLTPGNLEIYYKRSADGGTTWSASKMLTWTSASYYAFPAIAIDSSNTIHVVWDDDTSGNAEIYYKKSTDGGATWSTSRRLTWTLGFTANPAIAVDSADNLHIVFWDNTPGNYEIYYKKNTDDGTTWTASQRLTWTSGDSGDPAIAIDSYAKLHVVWEDETPGNFEIYYKKSTNGGATWSTSQRLSCSSGFSEYPTIAADSSGNLHVVWEDDTPGNSEIYYKKFIK
jgi:hypothetical protein